MSFAGSLVLFGQVGEGKKEKHSQHLSLPDEFQIPMGTELLLAASCQWEVVSQAWGPFSFCFAQAIFLAIVATRWQRALRLHSFQRGLLSQPTWPAQPW